LQAEIAALKATIQELKTSEAMVSPPALQPAAALSADSEKFLKFASFAVENLSDGTFLISKEGRVVYVNDSACRSLGYTKEEMIGMSMLEINPGLTQEIWDTIWEVTAKEKKQSIETEHKTKDGQVVPVEVLANYLEFDGREYSCAFARDITERRNLERRIRQSEKMEAVGQLAGGIAHDFNNQLAGIIGYTDILSRELTDRPDLARFTQAVLTSATRSAELTAQLLAFSRQGKYLSTPVNLHQIIEEVVLMLKRSIDKRIVIKTAFRADNPMTTGDPSQLENAVLNLAINARDAMPEGGELIFSTVLRTLDEDFCKKSPFHVTSGGRYICITVADTGIGMDRSVQDRMFEPFFTTKEKGKGTGLGLAAVYGTVKTHKGAVAVHSEFGRGTEMMLYFPLLETREETGRLSLPPSPSTHIEANVLLVEDEDSVRAMAEEMLIRLGCKVRTAKNGKEAVAVYGESFLDIDLVVLDLVMPEMSGGDTLFELQKINPSVTAVIASGYSLDNEVSCLLRKGAKGFIPKPFRLDALAATISEALHQNKEA
jgi:PAS domain S-box-containing protein